MLSEGMHEVYRIGSTLLNMYFLSQINNKKNVWNDEYVVASISVTNYSYLDGNYSLF